MILEHSNRIELNVGDIIGRTALMWAIVKGHKDVVELLLDHSDRIELNAKDNHGKNALMIAHQRGRQDIVQMVKQKLSFS